MMPAVGRKSQRPAATEGGLVGRAWGHPHGIVDRTLHVEGMAQ